MKNQLLEFSGKTTVILRALDDYEIGSYSFTKGQIVLCLDDMDISYGLNENRKQTGASVRTEISYHEQAISAITLSASHLDTEFLDIFYEQSTPKFSYPHISQIESSISEYCVGKLDQEKAITVNGKVVNYIYDETNNSITFDEEKEGELIYYIEKEGLSFSLQKHNHIPFLSMEVYGKGNKDKETTRYSISFEKVALLSRPSFSSQENSSYSLTFTVLNDNIVFGVENGE